MKPKKFTVVIGAQWGDEGKGKLVDALAGDYAAVGRFNGGNNAGHTVIYKNAQVKLHVLPSGVFQRKKLLIAQGAVFDPEILVQELKECRRLGIVPDLLIDYRVNLVMPYHKLLDGAHEAWKGSKATGSVKVGIGYAYEDRNNRSGIRCEDLLYPNILKQKIETLFPLKKAILEKVYKTRFDIASANIVKRLTYLGTFFKQFVGDVTEFVQKNTDRKNMLFEGAMATMLDAHFGTYPYTVANHTIASSIFSSLGIPERPLSVIGVVKAYTTRVGGGPFPTEQKNQAGSTLQEIGREIAATSGRIRRCGWLDLPILRYAQKLNAFSEIALTKLDVISNFARIPVCVRYKRGKKFIDAYPAISHEFYRCKPVYENLPGWQTDISQVRRYSQLPAAARNYIRYIEKEIGVKVGYVSVGPEREALIKMKV